MVEEGGEGSGKKEEACTCMKRAMLYKSLETLMTMIYCESVIVLGCVRCRVEGSRKTPMKHLY
jgi:hypothetical protein